MNVRYFDYNTPMSSFLYGYNQYQNYPPQYPQPQYAPASNSPVYAHPAMPLQTGYRYYYNDQLIQPAYHQQQSHQQLQHEQSQSTVSSQTVVSWQPVVSVEQVIQAYLQQIALQQMQYQQYIADQQKQYPQTQPTPMQLPQVEAQARLPQEEQLSYWKMQRQKFKQRKKEKQRIKQEAKEFLKKLEPNKLNANIKESLSEKILHSKYLQGKINEGNNAASIKNRPKGMPDYSQNTVLKKISEFLEYIGESRLSNGYCHGISLAWLTFMYLGLEKIFYEMIKTISNCPTNQLHTISDVILTFLDFIDVGQNPDRHSNKKCSQKNVGEIIGNVGSGEFIEKEMTSIIDINTMIKKHANEKVMVVVGGKSVVNGVKQTGHSIGLFKRSGQYHVFDPNYPEGEAKIFDTSESASQEADAQIAAVANVKNREKFLLEFYVVRNPKSLSKQTAANNSSVISSNSAFWHVHRNKKTKFVALPEYSSGLKRYTL